MSGDLPNEASGAPWRFVFRILAPVKSEPGGSLRPTTGGGRVSFLERLPFILLAVGILLVLVLVPLYLLLGGLRTFALKPLRRCYDGIQLHEAPEPGDVQLVYHTYRGLLLWVTQDEHRVIAPPEDAERLLGRLLRFNLTWGMLSLALLFVPFLAISNYYAQRCSIREQSSKPAPPGAAPP